VSTTRWERRKALSNQVRGVWDAHRGRGDAEWMEAFQAALDSVSARLRADADILDSMNFDEFKRLQQIGPVSAEGVSS
jgi:hypothetical protein